MSVGQLLNIDFILSSNLLGIEMVLRFWQNWNALSSSVSISLLMMTVAIEPHPANAFFSTVLTVEGRSTVESAMQP